MVDLTTVKAAARQAAFARRKAAKGVADEGAALSHLADWLAPHRGAVLSGYMAIRTELDPLPVMAGWDGPVCVPVILGKGQPLAFHRWSAGCELLPGPFGATVPASGEALVPDVLIVPLLAFNREGGRLGYGGGFYDRSLEGLRAIRPTLAIGFTFGAQEADDLPLEPTDQPLDMIVTEAEVIDLRG